MRHLNVVFHMTRNPISLTTLTFAFMWQRFKTFALVPFQLQSKKGQSDLESCHTGSIKTNPINIGKHIAQLQRSLKYKRIFSYQFLDNLHDLKQPLANQEVI